MPGLRDAESKEQSECCLPPEQGELPTRLPSLGLARRGKDQHVALAQLGATKDAGLWFRWDLGQAGEGRSVSESWSGAGVSEPGRSWPKRSLGR